MSGHLPPRRKLFAVYQQSSDPGDIAERRQPELAGVKIWPARGGARRREIPSGLRQQHKVQTWLQVLPVGTRFRTTLRFHNLRVCEIGAVLWALCYGDAKAWTPGAAPVLRHRLGMGKPFGLGEISFRIDAASARVWPNQPAMVVGIDLANWVAAFEKEVGTFTARNGIAWTESVQVKTLLRAADPTQGAGANLEYMQLIPPNVNQFQDEKSRGHFLPRYSTGAEFPRTQQTGTALVGHGVGTNPGAADPVSGHPPPGSVRMPAAAAGTGNETIWDQARLQFNVQNGRLTAFGPGRTTAYADEPRGPELFFGLPADVQRQVRDNPRAVRVIATVRGSQLLGITVGP